VRQALASPGRQGLLLASLVLVCAGASLNFGGYSPAALGCELFAIALLAAACTVEDRPISRWSWLAGLCALSVCDLRYTLGWSLLEAAFAALALASAVLVARAHPSRIRLVVALTAASAAVAGTVIVGFHAGVGRIDVFDELVRSANALIHGHNPYGPLTPIYIQFDPQTGALNAVLEHFPYLPVAALVAVPGALLGDPRLSTAAVAVIIGVAMLVLWRRADDRLRPRAEHALLLAVLFPLLPGMILFAWVDLEIAAGLAVWLALRERSRLAAVLALGLGMCVKPTAFLVVFPLALRSCRHAAEVVAGVAIAVALIVPFALITGIPGFAYAVLGVQLEQSIRPDSLALSSLLYADGLHKLPLIIPVVTLLLAAVHVIRHRPRTLGAALTGAAFIGLVNCVFNTFAYFNYYALVAAVILLALLAPGRSDPVATDAATPRTSQPPPRFDGSWLHGCE
jgi:hypothetical protein